MKLTDAVILIITPIVALFLVALVYMEFQIQSLETRVKALHQRVFGVRR